jgi:hypothetical protein
LLQSNFLNLEIIRPTGKKMISFPSAELSEDDFGRFRVIKDCIALENNMFFYGDLAGR